MTEQELEEKSLRALLDDCVVCAGAERIMVRRYDGTEEGADDEEPCIDCARLRMAYATAFADGQARGRAERLEACIAVVEDYGARPARDNMELLAVRKIVAALRARDRT